jgi:hypothetical protein
MTAFRCMDNYNIIEEYHQEFPDHLQNRLCQISLYKGITIPVLMTMYYQDLQV